MCSLKLKTLLKRIKNATASDSNSDMNVNLELEVDNNFRFATTPDKEINTLKNNRLAKKKEKGESVDFLTLFDGKLNEILPKFYVNIRKKDGSCLNEYMSYYFHHKAKMSSKHMA